MDAMDLSKIVLETERLILRPFEEGDLADLYAYASVPGVGEMAGWPHHQSMDVTRAVLRSFIECGEVLALWHKADQKVIGSVGMHAISSPPPADVVPPGLHVREIGYVLAKAYWGQGLMPEAVHALMAYGFEQMGLDALTCGHFAFNGQSRRVIEKCGFVFALRDERHAKQLQRTYEHLWYALTRQQWADERARRLQDA